KISQLEIKENPNVTRYHKKIDLFIIKPNFILHPNNQLEKIIKNDLGLIRNNLVYANTNTYKLFRDFKRELDSTYDSKIKDVEQKLITFQQDIIEKYPIESLMHDDLNEEFIESVFDATDHTEYNELKSLLHINELSYARDITDKYTKFKKLLEEELIKLVNDLS
ncbi:hypothetical protein ACEF17_11700, partial [Streptococcus hyovaginalis]